MQIPELYADLPSQKPSPLGPALCVSKPSKYSQYVLHLRTIDLDNQTWSII